MSREKCLYNFEKNREKNKTCNTKYVSNVFLIFEQVNSARDSSIYYKTVQFKNKNGSTSDHSSVRNHGDITWTNM